MLPKRLLQCHPAVFVCRTCRRSAALHAGQRRGLATDTASHPQSETITAPESQIRSASNPTPTHLHRDASRTAKEHARSPAVPHHTAPSKKKDEAAKVDSHHQGSSDGSVSPTSQPSNARRKTLAKGPASNIKATAKAHPVTASEPEHNLAVAGKEERGSSPDIATKSEGTAALVKPVGVHSPHPRTRNRAKYRHKRTKARAKSRAVAERAVSRAAAQRETASATVAGSALGTTTNGDEQQSGSVPVEHVETAAISLRSVRSKRSQATVEAMTLQDAMTGGKSGMLRRLQGPHKSRSTDQSDGTSDQQAQRRKFRGRFRTVKTDGPAPILNNSAPHDILNNKSASIEQRLPTKKASKTSSLEPLVKLGPQSLQHAKSIVAIDSEQPPVPRLAHGLDRVLFNPGVYQLQDPRSYVYNFDPYLEHIMPAEEFDFSALKAYKTSSEDTRMSDLAKSRGKKYYGSTSSMTAALSQFHYLISHFRSLNTSMLSRSFRPDSTRQTALARAPASIFLRYKNGTHAIDSDKEFDTPNVLMMLGKSMEKLLTLSKPEFERYRKSNPEEVPEEERSTPEPFQYTELGDLLMRSQLDAQDPRLPGTGTFDLKTRCVISKRMDMDSEESTGYEIKSLDGQFESYEREYYDMMRSTMLKYMLQVRMGKMDGIFVAYHNIQRIFGFQYVSLQDMDLALHSRQTTNYGWAEYEYSLRMLTDVLNQATKKFPQKSLRVLFDTEGDEHSAWCGMRIFAEPVTEEQVEDVQRPVKDAAAEYERRLMAGESLEDVPVPPTESSTAAAVLSDSIEASESPTGAKEAQDTGLVDDSQKNEVVNLEAAKTESKVEETGVQPKPSSKSSVKHKPLYAAVIVTESSVHGRRVSRASSAHEWTLTYEISEFPESRMADAWHLYDQSKARREKAFKTHAEADGSMAGGEISPKVANIYITMLRKLAKDGRKYRAARTEKTKDRPVEVWMPDSAQKAQTGT